MVLWFVGLWVYGSMDYDLWFMGLWVLNPKPYTLNPKP